MSLGPSPMVLNTLFPTRTNTLAARGLEERVLRVSLIFGIIVSFMLFIVLLSLMYFFRRISDSRFMILKNSFLNLLGLCRFPLNHYLICRHVRTDRQTDEFIRVGLGNLSVPR